MINRAYIYESKETTMGGENYETKDFFSCDYGSIQKLIKENFKYFEYIKINNNDRLETVAYDRYDDESFADLIVMINSGNFLWMVPYDNDIQISVGEAYSSYVDLEINLARDENKDAWIKRYGYSKSEGENEIKHDIIVPRVQYIEQVESLLSKYRQDNSEV